MGYVPMETALSAEAEKAASPVLAALHDTATDLHKAGFMDLKSLREYDALCLDDEVFEADDIVALELTRFRGHIWSLGFRPRLFRTLR